MYCVDIYQVFFFDRLKIERVVHDTSSLCQMADPSKETNKVSEFVFNVPPTANLRSYGDRVV